MTKRNLNLGTDYIEGSDEPMQFPADTMTDEELNEKFDELMATFARSNCKALKRAVDFIEG